MKKLFLFAVLIVFATNSVLAQDETVRKIKKEAQRNINRTIPDSVEVAWRKGGIFNLNLAQGSLKNWAAGGDKFSITINSNLNLFSYYKNKKHYWDNVLDLNLGYLSTTTLGTRKNDDRIDFLSKYGYKIAPKWNLVGLGNFRSQMLNGYTYEENKDTTVRRLVSGFMAPAYILISPGIEFVPNKTLSAFLSPLSARWTVVMNDSLAVVGAYGVDSSGHVKGEFGAFATINFVKDFNKTFSLKSRLDLYSNYLNNPKNADLFFTNMLLMKLTDWFAVTYNLDLIYDDDVRLFGPLEQSPALQIKSILGVGLVAKF